MTELEKLFSARDDDELLEDAIENLVLSVQIALQQAMHRGCVSQRELAERMGVSPARVSQILTGEQANLTLKTIGKIAFALGEDFELVERDKIKPKRNKEPEYFALAAKVAPRNDPWRDRTANSNRYPDLMAA